MTKTRKIAIAVGILVLFTSATCAWLFTRRNWTQTVPRTSGGVSRIEQDAVIPMARGIDALPANSDSRIIQQIAEGQTEQEIRSILGTPSDKGDDGAILHLALKDRKNLLQERNYYLRYRYKDNVLLILVFDRNSSRLIHFRVSSWSTRLFF